MKATWISRLRSGLAALAMAATPLATFVSCDPYAGFDFFRYDEDEYSDDYYYDPYYVDVGYDDWWGDCYYECW